MVIKKKLTDKKLGIFWTCFVHALGVFDENEVRLFHKYGIKIETRPGLKHRC
jgi:hypothetical protein